jgi:Uma2 family endonuclease
MSRAAVVKESQPLILHLGPISQKMSDHEFFVFCQSNPEWRLERTREGDLVVIPPRTGTRNFTLIGLFSQRVEADGTGLGFDSPTGFTLTNGVKRSPDVAWVGRSRWETLSVEEQEEFSIVSRFCSRPTVGLG